MRNKTAKRLKKQVAIGMYVGDGVTEQDIMDDRKSVYASPDFKKVFRARKKNYLKFPLPRVKHMEQPEEYDPKLKNMMLVRVAKQKQRRKEIKRKRK